MKNTVGRIGIYILSVLLGLLFVVSAYLKVYPIEPLEYVFVSIPGVNWFMASFMARLLISMELLLGGLMIFSFYPRKIYKIVIFVTALFCIYIAYLLLVRGNDANCLCMGYKVHLSPIHSLLKNSIIILTALILDKYAGEIIFPFKKQLMYILFAVSLVLPHIWNYIELNDEKLEYHTTETIHLDSLRYFHWAGDTVDLYEGKKIVGFFIPGCRYCKFCAQKMLLIQKKTNSRLPFYIYFTTTKGQVDDFLKETEGFAFSYNIISEAKFFQAAGSHYPIVLFVEDGKIIEMHNFKTISQKQIESFLKE